MTYSMSLFLSQVNVFFCECMYNVSVTVCKYPEHYFSNLQLTRKGIVTKNVLLLLLLLYFIFGYPFCELTQNPDMA